MWQQIYLKNKTILAGLLTLLFVVFLSHPVKAVPADVQIFVNRLIPQMETLLRQELNRREVFFDVTPKPQGNATRLEPYSRIDRDTVFDVTVSYEENMPVLKGKVFDWQERDLIESVASATFKNGARSQLAVFPYNDVELDYGITIKPYSNLYTKPSTEIRDLATQVRLGTPVKLLQYNRDRNWVRVRIEDDGYLAWIRRSELIECDRTQFEEWLNSPKVQLATTIDRPQTLYFGTRLKYLPSNSSSNVSLKGVKSVDFVGPFMPEESMNTLSQGTETITVALPDNRTIQLNRRDVIVSETPTNKSALIEIAKQFLPKEKYGGGSYLWGGTVGTRVDCSGFVQTVFRSGHIYLPRDAYQQKLYTQPVAGSLRNLDELQPGDLVFFSENRRLATHVGIYIGNDRFIHSTPRGAYSGVKINTLRNGNSYDRYFQRTYFGGGRVPTVLISDRSS